LQNIFTCNNHGLKILQELSNVLAAKTVFFLFQTWLHVKQNGNFFAKFVYVTCNYGLIGENIMCVRCSRFFSQVNYENFLIVITLFLPRCMHA